MKNTASNIRIEVVDVLRGIALIAMATYHFSWDLELFGFLQPGTAGSGPLKFYARAIASSFLFLVGFSLVLATQNGINFRLFFMRIGKVTVAALIISIATFFAMPENWIFFGILHHIVLASIIGLAFMKLHWMIPCLAAIAAFTLPHLALLSTQAEWLSFIGLFINTPSSNDFVPLFPWLAASFAGIAAAKITVKSGLINRLSKLSASRTPARQLKFLGRHSLLFYILHQPVLISVVWLAAQFVSPLQIVGEFHFQCKSVCEKQFSVSQCKTYCNCFEFELKNNAAQWSQLPAEKQSEAISRICSQTMQETLSR